MEKHCMICADFMFIILSLFFPPTMSSNCELSTINGLYTADCSHKKLTSVPVDLDISIAVLILTGNRIDSWRKNSFTRYPNLKELYINSNRLSYAGFISPIDNSTFSTLAELELLDARNMDLYSWKISLPKSIRVIFLSDNNIKNNPSFAKYANLEILNMSNCNLMQFPMLHEDAPIKILEFGGNNLEKFTVADLAPFCQLEYLGIDWSMSMSDRWCECTKIKTWLETIKIQSTLTYCPKSYEKTKTCDLKFDKDLLAKFDTCLEKIPKKNGLIVVSVIFVAILMVMAVFYFILLAYSKRQDKINLDDTLRNNIEEPEVPPNSIETEIEEEFEDEMEAEERNKEEQPKQK